MAGIVPSSDGWFDDDLVFIDAVGVRPVVDPRPGSRRATASRTGSCRSPTASGSRSTFPAPRRWLTAEDGHLTIATAAIDDVHAWLLARFEAGETL